MTKGIIEKVTAYKNYRITNAGDIDSRLLNCTAWIVSRYCPRADIYDIDFIYESLTYNCEIVDINNINNYDVQTIEKLTGRKYKTVKCQLEKGYFYLFNFYYLDDKGCMVYKDCSLKFSTNYNIF